MKKVITLVAIATLIASCGSDKTNSSSLTNDSIANVVDSMLLDSVEFESTSQDTLILGSVN